MNNQEKIIELLDSAVQETNQFMREIRRIDKESAESAYDTADCITEAYQALVNQFNLIELCEIIKDELTVYIIEIRKLKEPNTIEGFGSEYGSSYNHEDSEYCLYYESYNLTAVVEFIKEQIKL